MSEPAMSTEPEEQPRASYKVFVRSEEFVLSRNQIQFDSPNFFTGCFLSGLAESLTHEVHIDRNPALFALVVEYLSGYIILPLSAASVPNTMSVELATRNLAEDALFYGLTKLHAMLTTPALPNVNLDWFGLGSPLVTFGDVLSGRLPPEVEWTEKGLCSTHWGAQHPVLIYRRNFPLQLTGVSHHLAGEFIWGSEEMHYEFRGRKSPKRLASMYPRVAFPHDDIYIADGYEDSLLHIDGATIRSANLTPWWRYRTGMSRMYLPQQGFSVLDGAFPLYDDLLEVERTADEPSFSERDKERSVFRLWADEMLFVMQTEDRHRDWRDVDAEELPKDPIRVSIKVLDVKARTRAAVLKAMTSPTSRSVVQSQAGTSSRPLSGLSSA
ncbi:hypothetical protein PUNSTDRAFT_122212 [Punctularia strigosozonata HHB-11173 SS5]|uniref:uncharacterized protein n=1 Tax=Punctularia strigosozonata (strain HHB-11173) TaxID=741275 RepID=UPI0004417568|nr:uncharacterized protein PUNSTDRAFT_122212 [Punctularia strigosozonata HHB-11173 SS5]EIN05776.1 hypothetical protein PUNSTDRAFT_122212 [Punctularia strigosozonata HHB-11173 SS5]